jgi:hypothetical protein
MTSIYSCGCELFINQFYTAMTVNTNIYVPECRTLSKKVVPRYKSISTLLDAFIICFQIHTPNQY